MIWNFITQVLVAIAISFLAYVIAPKPKTRQPDSVSPPDLEEPTAEVGKPIPVVFGTATIKDPNVLHYTDKKRLKLNSKSRPNLSSYHMTVHYGICFGPVDEIRRIRYREKTIFGTPSSPRDFSTLVWLNRFGGGVDNEGGIRGRIYFQDGGSDQVLSSEVAEKYDGTPGDLPGYRGLMTACFTEPRPNERTRTDGKFEIYEEFAETPGFWWSMNSPFIHPVDFMVTRIPRAWYSSLATIPSPITNPLVDETSGEEDDEEDRVIIPYYLGPDANPIHIIREALTNVQWGAGIPEALLDEISFRYAAETLFQERFGLSLVWRRESTVQDFIQVVLNHIEATLYVSPETGLFTIRLLRDDYRLADLLRLDETNSKVDSFIRKTPSEIPNEVKLTWTNAATEGNEYSTLQNLARIQQADGVVIPTSVQLPGIRNDNLARSVVERELISESAGLHAAEVKVNRTAWNLSPGAPFLLSSDEHNVHDLVMRVLEVDFGRPGDSEITANVVEDVFARIRPKFGGQGKGITPGRPRNFTGVCLNGGVELRWEPPANIGIDDTTVYQYRINGGPWIDAGKALSVRILDLVNGTAYRFQARAKNAIGGGQPTRYIEMTPRPEGATQPGPLQDFSVSPVGGDFLLAVVPPLDDGCSPVFKYQYRIGENGDWINFPEGATTVRVEEPGTDTSYAFWARACNAIGPGPEMGPVFVSLTDPLVGSDSTAVPPMPLQLTATAGIGIVALFWENPFSRYQNHRITRVYRAETDDITQAVEVGTSNNIVYIDEDVEGRVEYFYWIRWESLALILGPSSASVSAIPEVSPAEMIRKYSMEILEDPLTLELLSEINTDLANETDVTRRVLEKVAGIRALFADEAYSRMEGDARALAIQDLRSDITTAVDGRIDIVNQALTLLEGTLNDRRTTAINTLRTELNNAIGDQINLLAEEITALEVSFGGRTLGPARNMFAAPGDNNTKAGAEAVRDAYQATNVQVTWDGTTGTWISHYDAEDDINIEISWSIFYLYQRRVAGAWVDNGEPLVHASAVTTLSTRITQLDGQLTALSQSITELMVNLEGLSVSAVQALETRITAAENLDGGTELAGLARWTVKLRVGDRVAGIGLVNDGGVTKMFINADRFAVIDPDSADAGDGVVPFFIRAGEVFIRSALIQDASINVAKIGRAFLTNLTAVHGEIAFARIAKGNIFDLTIEEGIQSDNYVQGVSGWRIRRNGDAEFNGDVIAANLRSWTPLWAGGIATPGGSSWLNFNLPDFSGYDALVVMGNGGSGPSSGGPTAVPLPVSQIPSGSTRRSFLFMGGNSTLATQRCYRIGYTQFRVQRSSNNNDEVGYITSIWGLRYPAGVNPTGSVAQVSSGTPDPTITTQTETRYGRFSALPSAPTGGTSTANHAPSGWPFTVQPTATSTQGVYRIRRTVTLSNGVFQSATAWGGVIRVASPTGPANRPPVVSAGNDRIAVNDGGAGINGLDIIGSASDPDGDSIIVRWTTTSTAVSLNDVTRTRLEVSIRSGQRGVATLTLTATDEHGASASDSMQLTYNTVPADGK